MRGFQYWFSKEPRKVISEAGIEVIQLPHHWCYRFAAQTAVPDTGANSLIVEYSSVPDTGSTAALLGAGVVALAFARRRLG